VHPQQKHLEEYPEEHPALEVWTGRGAIRLMVEQALMVEYV
jgi:hypothetical protein